MALVPLDVQAVELLGLKVFQALLASIANDSAWLSATVPAVSSIRFTKSSSIGTWIILLYLAFAMISLSCVT